MKSNLLITISLGLLTFNAQAIGMQKGNDESCYSAYHLQQKMDMSVQFGEVLNQQKTELDIDMHVRETPTENKYLELVKKNKGEGKWNHLRSYIVWIDPNVDKGKGAVTKSPEHYRHPFMAIVNSKTGEILDLESTTKNKNIITKYMSLFDLFQYTNLSGKHRYRNGNGFYTGKIVKDKKNIDQIIKSNQGYLNSDNEVKKGLKIIESNFNIDLAKATTTLANDCFYKKGNGVENFKTTLSAQSSISAISKFVIASEYEKKLKQDHFFFELSSDLSTWPSFVIDTSITKDQALSKLPDIVLSLSALIKDEANFLETMIANKAIWPYLADYIQETGISNDLSLQLFWSLDRIDSPDSVDALAKLVTAPLNPRDHFRSVMALGSTDAALSDNSVDLLHEKLESFSNPEKVLDRNLTFVRVLGTIARNRNETDPVQSEKLRALLYSKVSAFDEKTNTAVIDAIGNLRNSIDDEGIEILMQGTIEKSERVRLSATRAFTRIPYKSEYSEKFLSQLADEDSFSVKSKIIEVLGNTDKSDLKVKKQLLSVVKHARDANYEGQSLKSLKKINYSFKDDDMKIFSNKLRSETNKKNQKLLASMILKHRRK